MPASDNFTGTTGQAIEARAGWALGWGVSCFTVNASGQAAKTVTTAANSFNSVWSAADDGSTSQRITADILGNNIGPVVFADSAGNGYAARSVGGTSLRIVRLLNGAPVATSLVAAAVANGLSAEIRASVVNGSTTVVELWQNGTLLGSYSDTGQTNPRLTGGRRGFAAFATTGTIVSGLDNFIDNSIVPTNVVITGTPAGFVWEGVRAACAVSYPVTWTTLPASVQARVVDSVGTAVSGFDWSTKIAAPAGGGGTVSFAAIPTGGPYFVQLRDSAVPGTVTVLANGFYVGAVIWVYGQSQASRMTNTAGSAPFDLSGVPTSGIKASLMGMNAASGDKTSVSPSVFNIATQAGAIGAGIVNAANQWMADTGNIPVMWVDCTFQGTAIAQWQNDQTANNGAGQTSQGLWTGIATPLATAAQGQCSAVLWRHGTADTSSKYATYGTDMEALKTKFLALLPTQNPLFIVLPHSRSNDGVRTWTMRNTQWTKATSGGAWRLGSIITDIVMDADNSPHQAPDATGFKREGPYWGRSAAKHLVTAGLDIAGPQITSATFTDGTRTAFDIVFDRTVSIPAGGTAVVPDWVALADDGATFPDFAAYASTVTKTGARTVRVARAAGAWATTLRFDFARGIPFAAPTAATAFTPAISEATNEANAFSKILTDGSAFNGRGVPVSAIMGTGFGVAGAAPPADVTITVTVTAPASYATALVVGA